MDLLSHYEALPYEENERDILCLLLSKNVQHINQGVKQFSKIISNHVGERDLTRLIRDLIPQLISSDAFLLDKNIYLTPKESLEMIDSILYLEILFEEFIKKSGRRGFFISHYKAVSHEWCYFTYEFILCKASGIAIKDLLALSNGLKQYDLNLISKWSKAEKLSTFVALTRKNPIGIFQDGYFMGFKSPKKINDVEDILQIIFEEINFLTEYFFKQSGIYFELFGKVPEIKTIPIKPIPTKKKEVSKAITVLSPLEKHLKTLQLKQMPNSKSELKKIFFQLAKTSHPDKFEHVNKGTQTEIAIVDKFREIYSAYEFIEKELDKIDNQ
jgi:hypothetical protein